MTELFVIAIMSLVQSLFGVGLLVFGTPTLLLLGYPFDRTLSILLPASIAISLLQMMSGPRVDSAFVRTFALWCLVPLGAVLAAVLWFDIRSSLNVMVALALTTFVILQCLPDRGERVRQWITKHQRAWLLMMGVVHGLSNLGGGLLTIFSASRYREKLQIRGLVAFCYACMATSQLIVLAAVHRELFGWQQLGYAAISGSVFLLIGQRVFRWLSTFAFDQLLKLVMTAYVVLLSLRAMSLL